MGTSEGEGATQPIFALTLITILVPKRFVSGPFGMSDTFFEFNGKK